MSKPLRTAEVFELALIRLLSGVDSHMTAKCALLSEAPLTARALEGFLSRVDPHVTIESRLR